MDSVTLRNGSVEPKSIVLTTMLALDTLWKSGLPGMLEVCDLHAIAQGKGADVNKNTIAHLQELELVQPDGKLHDSVRNIVLSACEGEGIHMTLSSPLTRANTSPKSANQEPPAASDPAKDAVLNELKRGGTLRYFFLDGGVAVHDSNDAPTKIHCSTQLFEEFRRAGKVEITARAVSGYPYYANRAKSDVYKLAKNDQLNPG